MSYHSLPRSPILSGMFIGFDGIMKSIPNPRKNSWHSHGIAIQTYWNIVGTRIARSINAAESEGRKNNNGTTTKT